MEYLPAYIEFLDNTTQKIMFKFSRKELNPNAMNNLADITQDEDFYADETTKSADYFYPFHQKMQTSIETGNIILIELVFRLTDLFQHKLIQTQRILESNKITFDTLDNIFKIGEKFVGIIDGHLVGSVVHQTEYITGGMGERYFMISGKLTTTNGKKFIQINKEFYVPFFRGTTNPQDLPVKPMTDEFNKILTERGLKFVKYGLSTHYKKYTGKMFINTPYGIQEFDANGRIMIDKVGYDTIYKSSQGYSYHNNSNNLQDNITIPDDLLFMTYPFLYGFSFKAKRWGQLYIDLIEDIQFDENAFDYLVLDQDLKNMVKSMILNYNNCFKDIITGKSGGCIFLLHGPPGTGKTLTCESVSELLKRPLYSITSGELGTNIDKLEQKLVQILEIAEKWNAVVLVDEADVFMEKRSTDNIERNAMVGVFLRLLERYDGIMFLTTNRENTIDEAFKSRISVSIKYDYLTKLQKSSIWKNLFDASGMNNYEQYLEPLSEHNFNGRQIKNILRNIQAISGTNSFDFELFKKIVKFM
jgi:hypothetical protein